MNKSSNSTADVLARAEQSHIKFIDLQFTDIVGVVKNVTIPVHELATALENGIWFDGSSIEGFARIAESDMHLRPDASTFAIIPWLTDEDATARLICDVFTPDSQPFPGDPRSILSKTNPGWPSRTLTCRPSSATCSTAPMSGSSKDQLENDESTPEMPLGAGRRITKSVSHRAVPSQRFLG